MDQEDVFVLGWTGGVDGFSRGKSNRTRPSDARGENASQGGWRSDGCLKSSEEKRKTGVPTRVRITECEVERKYLYTEPAHLKVMLVDNTKLAA